MVTRYRVQLIGDRIREATRLEVMLEDASIELSTVASSLITVSARAMLAAMIAGERDPVVLAELAEDKLRAKIPALTARTEPRLVAGAVARQPISDVFVAVPVSDLVSPVALVRSQRRTTPASTRISSPVT